MLLIQNVPEGDTTPSKSANWPRWLLIPVCALLLAACGLASKEYEYFTAAERPSPWDSAPPEQTSLAYHCDAALQSSESEPVTTAPSGKTETVGENQALPRATTLILARVEKAADTYKTTGNRAASICLLDTLEREASIRTPTLPESTADSREARQLSAGALAVALLKVRPSTPFKSNPEQVRRILAWLRTEIQPTVLYYEDGGEHPDAKQVWAAFDLLAVSIACNDADLYERGSNLLSGTLWKLAPRIDSRSLEGSTPLQCSSIVPALAPAALAMDIEVAAGFGSERKGIERLHEVAVHCIDHRKVTPHALQARTVDSPATDRRDQSIAWLVDYLPTLASSGNQLTQNSSDLSLLMGGEVKI